MKPLDELTRRVDFLEATLATALLWIGQSASSPLRADEISRLLSMMKGER